ncbi:MAG: hypothetical protein AAF937_07585 [Planctomycetota bacterium]
MRLSQWIGAVACAAAATHAVADVVGTRAAFDAAFPTAAFEDFEEARVADGGFALIDNVLDSTTSNDVFFANEIEDGLRLTVGLSSTEPQNLFVSSPGFANYVSHAISFNGANTATPQITIDFTNSDVIAFGFDVTGNPDGTPVTVDIFSGADLLDTVDVNGTGVGTFVGFDAGSDIITSVTLSSGSVFFGVDNVAFAVPTPGSAAVLGLGALAAARRRR